MDGMSVVGPLPACRLVGHHLQRLCCWAWVWKPVHPVVVYTMAASRPDVGLPLCVTAAVTRAVYLGDPIQC
jgi:hypothetical protein